MIDKNITSQALAAQVVVYRSLGLNKELAAQCMEELSKRRLEGDLFEYEKFIKDELNKIPSLSEANVNIFQMFKK